MAPEIIAEGVATVQWLSRFLYPVMVALILRSKIKNTNSTVGIAAVFIIRQEEDYAEKFQQSEEGNPNYLIDWAGK